MIAFERAQRGAAQLEAARARLRFKAYPGMGAWAGGRVALALCGKLHGWLQVGSCPVCTGRAWSEGSTEGQRLFPYAPSQDIRRGRTSSRTCAPSWRQS